MAELGIDIRSHWSKSLTEYQRSEIDLVFTVCDRAREQCPIFAGTGERLHWSFDDPAEAPGADDERSAVFRRVRDEIRIRIERFVSGHRSDALDGHTHPDSGGTIEIAELLRKRWIFQHVCPKSLS